ncbi:DUF433 domain-containing protein [Sphingomonas oligoaromativorans]|uniref:DUF433 domain-containing protein n=1 Tax=Sphingomonas oligoaromativorans TaxID=575322 RepID=UPI0014214A5D|nr:uncharacterized protein (DUF433 family) [Sphingomonas oligoaromativorans]
MDAKTNIIGAFSEDQVSRLTGLTHAQLRRWNRSGFIRPEYLSDGNARSPFTFIYSFKDLLKLRVLNQLRNVYSVPMSELRRVEATLEHLGDAKWTSQKLWVHNRKVVFEEPESLRKREVSTRQFVAEIPLAVVTTDARDDIRRMNEREKDQIGTIEKRRHVHSSDPVFAGTRIPVSAIVDYIDAKYTDDQILAEFPDLTKKDIAAARRHMKEAA